MNDNKDSNTPSRPSQKAKQSKKTSESITRYLHKETEVENAKNRKYKKKNEK